MESEPASTPKPPNRKPLVFGLLAVAVLAAFGLGPRLNQANALKAEITQRAAQIPSVSVVKLSTSSNDADLTLPSNIQAIEQTTINARTSGYVAQRLVDIGSRVTKGQLLAVVESPELDQQLVQSEAEAIRSQAGLGVAHADSAKLRATISAARSEEARTEAARMQANADLVHLKAKEQEAQSAVSVARAHETEANKRFSAAKAELNRNKAALSLATKTLNRWKELEKAAAVSGQDVDEKQAAYDSAQAQVEAGEANVSSAQAAALAAHETVRSAIEEVAAARADVQSGSGRIRAADSSIASSKANIDAARSSYTAGLSGEAAAAASISSNNANVSRVRAMQSFERITAPFSGVITARNVDVGDLVNSTSGGSGASDQANAVTRTGLFGLAQTDVLRAQINVPESNIATVHEGQATEVTVQEYPNRVFKGTVFRVSGALDTSSRTLLVEVQVPNTDGALKPGMYAQIKFRNSKGGNSIWLPANALVFNGQGTRVAIVTSENKLHYVVVKLGRDLGDRIEVLSGLSGDETVVSNPDDSLPEGATVNPVAARN